MHVNLKALLLAEVPADLKQPSGLKAYDGQPCPYCTRIMNINDKHLAPSRDHIIPKKNKKRTRTIVVCMECNRQKSAMLLPEYLSYLILKNSLIRAELETNEHRIMMLNYLVMTGLK